MLISSKIGGETPPKDDPVRIFQSAAYTIRALRVAHGRKLDPEIGRHALVKLKEMRASLLALENHQLWRPRKSVVYTSACDYSAGLKPSLPISRETRDGMVRDLDLFIFQLERRFPANRYFEALEFMLRDVCAWLEGKPFCRGHVEETAQAAQ